MSNRMESNRERALADKVKTKGSYRPPPVSKMKYCIIDKQLRLRIYFLTKKKFSVQLRKFEKLPDFQDRFRTILNSKKML
jgi:hypothetical protein